MTAHHARLSPNELLGLTLPACTGAKPARAVMDSFAKALLKAKPSWDLLGPHVAFASAGYLRKRLYRDDDWEMLLLCWLPGQKTVIHDHGGSWGSVLVLSGCLDERQFETRGEGRPPAVVQRRTFGPGSVALEAVEAIHKNENLGYEPAVSLHFYSPPLRVLNSYDAETGSSHAVHVHEGPTIAVGGRPVSSRGKPLATRRGTRGSAGRSARRR